MIGTTRQLQTDRQISRVPVSTSVAQHRIADQHWIQMAHAAQDVDTDISF